MSYYLFICNTNITRGPLGARKWKELLSKNNIEAKVESRGIKNHKTNLKTLIFSHFTKHVTQGEVYLADRIFVMEPWMKDTICQKYNKQQEGVICLNVQDSIWPWILSFKVKREINQKLENYFKENYKSIKQERTQAYKKTD